MRLVLSGCLAAASVLSAVAEDVRFDRVHGTEGVDSSYGGPWTLESHSPAQQYWTTDGGETWRDWTSADIANVAVFVSSVGLNMPIDASAGDVNAAGLWVQASGEGKGATFTGDRLGIGAQGVTYVSRDVNAVLKFSLPVSLISSQTWRSYNDSTKLTAGTMVQIYGGISVSENEAVTLTLDGAGCRSPVISQSTDLLTGFGFYANLGAVGTLVLTNGVTFAPMYTAAYPDPKLGTSSTLVLAGGSVSMRGATCTGETVSRTRLVAGENQIRGYNAKLTTMNLGVLVREGRGSTLDINNADYGGTITTADVSDAAMLGWASFAKSMFASVASGVFSQVSEKQRAVDNWATDGLTAVRATSGGTFTVAAQNPGTLRIFTTDAIDLSSCAVTIATGGFMLSASGSLVGGTIMSGCESGELFAHVFADYTVGSVLADRGGVPLSLVKSGSSTLTLTGRSTNTGTTYLNAGRLAFASAAKLDVPIVQKACSTLAFADGGTLVLDAAAPRVLHGDLELGAGSVIEAVLGGSLRATMSPLVTMDTPLFKSVSTPVENGQVKIIVSVRDASGGRDALVKGIYPLIATTDANPAALDGLSADAFSLELPDGVEGGLVKDGSCLFLQVTRVKSGMTIILR